MVTGTEKTLSERLANLIKLDFDAINAYDEAIGRLDDAESKQELTKFKADHQRHTEELSAYLSSIGETPPTGGGVMSILTQGKVMLADLFGDKALLKAMKINEDVTNTAYEAAVQHDDSPAEVKALLERNLADERRHREWIEARAEAL